MSFDFVKMVTFGGEKSDESLYRQVKQIFPNAQIRNIYASTEAGALLSSKNNLFLIPNDKSNLLKIVDNELLIHKTLIGSSDNLVLVNDFYHSGDLIEWVDESNGFFRFVSRKNESINVGGYKINPSEIEALICEIEGVQNAIVFGKVNSVLGNILCAEVIIFDNYVLSELSIKNYLKQKLQSHKIPRHIKFVDNFLMTKTGKIQRL
jgi:acyl-CoA synthetase (AMP-forming)/AMP-acid ligase II